MNQKLIFSIAKSLLLARWKQTLVAAIGVTFSITMFIALLSFMSGINYLLDSMILNRTPHIRLYNDIKPNKIQPINSVTAYKNNYNFIQSIKATSSRQEIYNANNIMQTIQNDSRVLGIAPKINTPVFFSNGGATDISGLVSGIDVEAEGRYFFFNDYIIAGSSIDLKNISNSIILGSGLADKLRVNVGDIVQAITTKGEPFPLKIVGFFQSGVKEFDKSQSFASIKTVQKILGKPNDYLTDIQVKLTDITLAPIAAKEYTVLFQIDAEDAQTSNSQIDSGSALRSTISYSVGVVLLIVAGFGIYNILNMMIYEKMDSIAILKATGFSGKDVNRIFIYIALSIGVFGGLLGLFFGLVVSYIIDQIPFNIGALPTVTTYPMDYNPAFYIIGLIFSLITTYFAGFFPARKASKIDPVIIIRGK